MNGTNDRRVKVLADSIARKIAAGEVIDRPFSVVRELLDNSIDAGATEIDVVLKAGGIDEILVRDNGRGMTKDDLHLCYRPHATSKISAEEDLTSIASLGFRGEALSSVSSVAHTRIITKHESEPSGWELEVHDGKELRLDGSAAGKGTSISVQKLFFNFPARKRFLKRPGDELKLCKTTFIEKALCFPDIQFRLTNDDKMLLFLPAGDQKSRVMHAYKSVLNNDLIHSIETKEDDFSFELICSSPSFYRKDRKYLQVFVNGRRIQEYSLMQAMEYAFSPHLPGGFYPYGFLFIQVNPTLVDFNIHPAKREARFKDSKSIHRSVVRSLGNFLYTFSRKMSVSASVTESEKLFSRDLDFGKASDTPERSIAKSHGAWNATPDSGVQAAASSTSAHYDRPFSSGSFGVSKTASGNGFSAPTAQQAFSSAETAEYSSSRAESLHPDEFTYLGQAMNLFLVVEKDDTLYLIDQHAAHERILYEEISRRTKSQALLIPEEITDLEEDRIQYLMEEQQRFSEMGLEYEVDGSTCVIKSIPEVMLNYKKGIFNFIEGRGIEEEQMRRDLYANMACKMAIKDNDRIDPLQARELIKKAFQLEHPRCPHGRPIWFTLSRDELYQLIGRT